MYVLGNKYTLRVIPFKNKGKGGGREHTASKQEEAGEVSRSQKREGWSMNLN